MLDDVTRVPLRVPEGAVAEGAVAEPRPGSPVVSPGDRTLEDARLALLGVRLPFELLGAASVGEPPADGRVRIPATSAEVERALAAGEVVVADAESTPVAVLTDLAAAGRTAAVEASEGWLEGRVLPLVPDAGALPAPKSDRRTVVAPARPLTSLDLDELREAGSDEVVVLVPTSGSSPDGIPAPVLRTALERGAPADFTLIPVPVAWRGNAADDALAHAIAEALGGTALLRPRAASETSTTEVSSGDAAWATLLGSLQVATTDGLAVDDPVLAAALPVLQQWRPPRPRRGLVVFFTGLSGSGKSTLARALVDHLTARSSRTVTLLDGDLVRRLLSSGLGYDRAGRDLNVRRIGFVAAEVARHGGIAVCAPIAPYAESRAAVRELVEAVGDLVLVHVATPLAECERRDVKGLYRRARAGVVTQFTGISDPYDEPLDAELRVDTSQASLDESLAVILGYLTAGGWLPATDG